MRKCPQNSNAKGPSNDEGEKLFRRSKPSCFSGPRDQRVGGFELLKARCNFLRLPIVRSLRIGGAEIGIVRSRLSQFCSLRIPLVNQNCPNLISIFYRNVI